MNGEDTVQFQFSEPRFHSVARAPHDSKPIIELSHLKEPCGFTIEFAVGSHGEERTVMRAHDVGSRQLPEVIRAGELLLTRTAIPVGHHEVKIVIRWEPLAP